MPRSQLFAHGSFDGCLRIYLKIHSEIFLRDHMRIFQKVCLKTCLGIQCVTLIRCQWLWVRVWTLCNLMCYILAFPASQDSSSVPPCSPQWIQLPFIASENVSRKKVDSLDQWTHRGRVQRRQLPSRESWNLQLSTWSSFPFRESKCKTRRCFLQLKGRLRGLPALLALP